MIDLSRDITSLTSFKRNSGALLRQMTETGRPMVLTVNGSAKLVALDVATYQELLNLIDRAEAIEGIRRGLRAVARGKTKAAGKAMDGLRRKHAISR